MPIPEKLQSFLQSIGERVASETTDVISTVIGKECSISLDGIRETSAEAIAEQITDPFVDFRFNLTPSEKDVVHLLLTQAMGAKMASLMMMEDETTEFAETHLDAVKEMGEQVLGNLATVLSGPVGRELRFGSVRVSAHEAGTDFPELDSPVALQYTFKIGEAEEYKILQLAAQEAYERFRSGAKADGPAPDAEPGTMEEETQAEEEMTLGAPGEDEGEAEPGMGIPEGAEDEFPDMTSPEDSAAGTDEDQFGMGGLGDLGDMGDLTEEPAAGGGGTAGIFMGGMNAGGPFAGEQGDMRGMPAGLDVQPEKIELLLDLSLPVSIELGRTKMLIKDILELGHGSVIEFDKLAGEPVDLLIYDKKVAEGEVVVIDEHFGIRLTNIIKTAERLKTLGTPK